MNKEQIKEIQSDIDYLFSKINWKDSFLDAKAIRIMNGLSKRIDNLSQSTELVEALEKIKNYTYAPLEIRTGHERNIYRLQAMRSIAEQALSNTEKDYK